MRGGEIMAKKILTKDGRMLSLNGHALTVDVSETPSEAVLYTEQSLTDEQKAQARENIGAGTSSFSGSYNDLADKPTIPEGYTLPVATSDALGGVKPAAKTDAMTSAVGVDADGKLWSAAGGGGSDVWEQVLDVTFDEAVGAVKYEFVNQYKELSALLFPGAVVEKGSYAYINFSTFVNGTEYSLRGENMGSFTTYGYYYIHISVAPGTIDSRSGSGQYNTRNSGNTMEFIDFADQGYVDNLSLVLYSQTLQAGARLRVLGVRA